GVAAWASRRRAVPGAASGTALGWSGRVALVVIVAGAASIVGGVVASPCFSDWDAWAVWGLKAKAVFVDPDVRPYLAAADAYDFSWPPRPCLTAVFQAFLYACLGRVDEAGARLVHVALWASLLLIFHGSLRRRLAAGPALLWTALLATVP